MKAVVGATGSAGVCWTFGEAPELQLGATELLVKVHAGALNRSDVWSLERAITGRSPGDPLFVAGREFAGEVTAVGDEVTRFAVGDRVMAMVDRGAFAEQTTIDERWAMPVPKEVSWTEAAAMPMGYLTEYHAIHVAARLRAGDAVLIHGATAGVATIGIQLAAALGLRPVIGTSRSAEKLEPLATIGLDLGVAVGPAAQFADLVLEATEGRGVDGVIDHVGAPYLSETMACMAVGGRLVSVGRVAGDDAPLNMNELARKRLELIGVTFRSRTFDERADIVELVIRDVLPLAGTSTLPPPLIDATFAAADAEQARQRLVANQHVGKLIVTFD